MGSYPIYYKEPVRWLRWCAYNKPNLFFPAAIALFGPVFLFGVTPIRKRFLYQNAAPLPFGGYPVPDRAREPLTGYDDEPEVAVNKQ